MSDTVPPFNVSVPVPREFRLLNTSVPSFTVVPPVKLWDFKSVRVPLPDLERLMEPLSAPEPAI